MEERPETELISIPATPRASTPEIQTPSGQRSPRPPHAAASKEAKSWTPTSFISPRFLSPIGTPMKRVLINMKGYLEEVGHLTKLNPQDAWLPITESRNGNAHYAAFHNLNAGVGFQALVLPVAFSFLGWSWGILSLTIAYFWQLYTLWILVQLHEAVPGKRYNRYVELAQAAFGERLGVWLALFPTVYLSAGTATALILIGGETMKLFFQIVCGPLCSSNPLSTVEWYLVFTSLCIVLSQLPNLNSISGLSLIGAITAITYSTMVWVLSVSQPRPPSISYEPLSLPSFSIRVRPNCPSTIPPQLSRQILFPTQPSHLGFTNPNGQGLYFRRSLRSISRAIDEGKRAKASVSSSSPWDEKPYELLPDGKRAYLDEQDVVAFLDPPKELIPLDPSSFNPAAYLWLKIEDVVEDRRHRLLHLLEPRLISRAWEIAGTRYEDPMLLKKHASSLLSNGDGVPSLEFWNGRTSGGPIPIAWINFFKKAIFHVKDGMTYGRLIGRSVIAEFASSRYPLYFAVRQHNEVMSTEQPCDLAYEFGDGFLGINEYPPGFPRPAKHPWPFNDQVVIYVRHLGPGVLVGQAWQEGEALEKLPQKLCGEILMVKDYAALCENECR